MAGTLPPGRKIASQPGHWRVLSTDSAIRIAMWGWTGKPSRASRMAVSATSAKDRVPNRSSAVSQPSGAPGTTASYMPPKVILPPVFFSYHSGVDFSPHHPTPAMVETASDSLE